MSYCYDDLETHYLNLEAEVEQHRVGIPTGFYLAWLIGRGWASPELMAHAEALRAGTTTGCELLWSVCDAKLLANNLNAAGNAFTRRYFEQRYFNDYFALFRLARSRPEALYEPDDTPAHATRVAAFLDGQVRAASVSAAMPAPRALITRLAEALQPGLAAAGFQPSGDYGRSERDESLGVRAAWPGGTHDISFGVFVDRQLGQHGVFADYKGRPDALVEAARAPWAPEELSGMSVVSLLLEPLLLPLHAWMPPHPCLRVVPALAADTSWIGGHRWLVAADAPEEIATAIELLRQQISQHLLPRLPEWQSVEAVARLKCRIPLTDSPAFHNPLDRSVLAVAELVRHPQLQALCDELERCVRAAPGLAERQAGRVMLRYIDTVRQRAAAG